MKTYLAFAALAGFATAAQAQLGGAWVDEYGRTTTFSYPKMPTGGIGTGERSAEEIARAFGDFCLGTGFDKAAIGAVVAKSGWRMDYVPAQMPFKKPAEVGGWRTDDAVLHATDGTSFPKPAQCSLVVQSSAVGTQDALVDAVTAVIGAEPGNLAKRLKKNGQPQSYWRAEWQLTSGPAAGRTVIVGRNPAAAKGDDAWQLALFQPRAPRKK
ncbi:MAG: hypothetical protein QOG72_1322 [Sphingomonadales bacterium]|jgi:hypothetical protein|nr:hypothetical protein [Sphingomonadales bacterium]